MPELKQWKLKTDENDAYFYLEGDCYGSYRFKEGHHIYTSYINGIFPEEKMLRVFTNNTEYICYLNTCAVSVEEIEGKLKLFKESQEEAAKSYRAVFGVEPDQSMEAMRKITRERTKFLIKYLEPDYDCMFQIVTDEKEEAIVLMLDVEKQEYFTAIAIRRNGKYDISTRHYVHVGTIQDSVILGEDGFQKVDRTLNKHTLEDEIKGELWNGIDIRYFPGAEISFYTWKTQGLPVYVFNCGMKELHIQAGETYTLASEAFERIADHPDRRKS